MIANTQWSKQKIEVRAILMFIITAAAILVCKFHFAPIFGIAAVWCGIIFLGIYANMIYNLFAAKPLPRLRYVWNVLLTFVFITSTRLFFRAGSNLDPAEANEVAWETARNMIHQIGSPWDLSILGEQAYAHLSIILVFLLGMTIHWLPDNFKRWYRMVFCHLPIPGMIAIAVVACFVIYQFSSADSPPFIYFQF
jgi:predicted membrane protein